MIILEIKPLNNSFLLHSLKKENATIFILKKTEFYCRLFGRNFINIFMDFCCDIFFRRQNPSSILLQVIKYCKDSSSCRYKGHKT